MKASTIRLATWLAATCVAGVGVWQLVQFLKERDQRLFAADRSAIDAQLRAPKKQDQALRKAVEFYDPIARANVRGVEPPKPVTAADLASTAPKVALNPVADVVDVRGTRVYAPDAKLSAAFMVWKDPNISEKDKRNRVLLFEGEAFPPPYQDKYHVARIEVGKVVVVDDKGSEFPLVVKELTTGRGANGSGGGADSRAAVDDDPASRPAGYEAPEETTKKSENEFWISASDAKEIEEKGLDLVGREVQTAPYLDPKTKRPTGLRVTLIRPNSIVSKLGLKEGDVVKEVNGTPIKSTSDLYTFSQEHPTVRTVLLTVERYGRLVTIQYVLP